MSSIFVSKEIQTSTNTVVKGKDCQQVRSLSSGFSSVLIKSLASPNWTLSWSVMIHAMDSVITEGHRISSDWGLCDT